MKKSKSSSYLSALATLTSGSFIGAIIISLRQVFQTRIFDANSIGIYTYLLAIPMMFIGVMSLRYDMAIITEEDNRKVYALIKLSVILIFIMGITISMFFLIYIYIFEIAFRQYLYILPFLFMITIGYGLYNAIVSFNNRVKEYILISKMYVFRTLVQHGGVLIFGYVFVSMAGLNHLSVLIMVVPYSLGLFAGIFHQSKSLLELKTEITSITISEMNQVAKKYWRQPIISTPALFLNSFSFSIVAIIMGRIFNTVVLGYYSVSNQILGMPLSLIAANVAKIFIERAAIEYNSTGKFIKAYKQSLVFLGFVSIFMFLVMYFVAPPLSEIVFGDGWGTAGQYIKILAPMFSIRLVGTAVSQGLIVCNKQNIEFVFNLLLVIASVGSGIVVWMFSGSDIMFLSLLSFTKSLCYLWLIIMVYHYAKGDKDEIQRTKQSIY